MHNDIPMIGDAAGMITPLCGNGMAIAIHSAYLYAEAFQKHFEKKNSVEKINYEYGVEWNKLFSGRLWVGRKIQSLFGNGASSNFAVEFGKKVKPVANFLMSKTHGHPF